MPPSFSSFSVFMEKKKPKDGGGDDELALVKAAAWAWYQHGSGSEGKSMCEFDATRTRQAPRPSRFMLETMRLMAEVDAMEESKTPSPIRSEISLLDKYEVESISKRLDYLIESSRSKRFYGLQVDFDRDDDRLHDYLRGMSSLDSDTDQISPMNQKFKEEKKKKEKKKSFLQRFWLRHSIVCGTRADVDTRAFVLGKSGSHCRKGMFQ